MEPFDETTREILQTRWFSLTRHELPDAAMTRDWPVHLDHCFQRILLDNACQGPWRDHIAPPAYRNASDDVLLEAIALGELVLDGQRDLAELNRKSLAWRGKLRGDKDA
ncbi:GCN5-related N-acetyltransferase [Paraurantiacibacter namhicola]|uniref:GCN5-related N-acetyltransferase n=1 Tax=Paraurantiacibacter namhicola TaxID=645517 RepID=A0A1C7D8P4_9SPHN|nr:GCN5-related N-acetyltransferase [Paraurantiacibacter namhicola]ANU07663.1 hypothetical protein A6F65_01357 [Paraurantiacibacter namhicola]